MKLIGFSDEVSNFPTDFVHHLPSVLLGRNHNRYASRYDHAESIR